ncbi:aldo/keto reductase [bacterium LRH843]|nr:aldo/keto reductase [bacterium LRH843]
MDQLNQKSPPTLTLGTVQLGLEYGVANKTGKPNKIEVAKILQYALLNDVTEFDTAPDYGESESLLGHFFQEQKKHTHHFPKISSKLPEIKMANNTPYKTLFMEVERHLKTTLNRLGFPAINSYYLHNERNLTSHNGKLIDCLVALKKQGLIHNIGASVYSKGAVEQVIEAECLDMIQVPINLFNQQLIHSGLLEQLSKHQIKIYARSIYLQGLLLMNSSELPEHLKAARKWLDCFHDIAAENKMDPSALAFCFVRDLPQIHSIVVGCETLPQLMNNIKMIALPKLPTTVVKQLMELFRDVPEIVSNPTYWK